MPGLTQTEYRIARKSLFDFEYIVFVLIVDPTHEDSRFLHPFNIEDSRILCFLDICTSSCSQKVILQFTTFIIRNEKVINEILMFK